MASDVTGGAATAAVAPSGRGAEYCADHIGKRFGGVSVLRDVSVTFVPGQIHTLLGENGAGKSTLLKIMAGMYTVDDGTLTLNGEELPKLSPREAQRRGIYLVPQEPRLMPDLSVAENLYLGTLPRGPLGRVDWRRMNDTTESVVSEVGLNVDPRTPAGQLSLAQQQLLECARALAHGCGVIFFDEPTSPLTAHDAEKLFALMHSLRERRYTLGFISHRLDEVEQLSDQITVLRDGEVVAREQRGSATRGQLVAAMVGRELAVVRRASHTTAPGKVLLQADSLQSAPEVMDISVNVREREIVGLAGLVGSGRTEFAEAIFGLRTSQHGEVFVDGKNVTGASPRQCIDAGLVYLAEDRGRNGIFAEVDIARNVTSAIVGRLPRWGFLLRRRKELELARQSAKKMDVRAAAVTSPMKTMSGGNQQKALLARWMLADPQVAIFDEPTRGVDVGAKESIYEIIETLAGNGLAALVISSETEELVRLCDRVYAVYEGRVVGELTGDDLTVESLGQLAVGAT
jgi:ABC-type sugar transport system ATPase subunit